MFNLADKVALVTGAGQNVGAGVALALAKQGATVVVNDYHRDRAERTCDAILAAGGKAIALAFDVTDLDAVTQAVAAAQAEVGPIDILVNNAGTGGPEAPLRMQPFRTMSADYWKTVVDVNLYGVLNCCHAVINGMVERGWGRIITMSSGTGEVGLDQGVAIYGATKSGSIGFMRHLATENAAAGVTCNTIALGLVLPDPAILPGAEQTIPVRRIGTPEDPGYLCVYLASTEASWMTGQTIGLNGGWPTS